MRQYNAIDKSRQLQIHLRKERAGAETKQAQILAEVSERREAKRSEEKRASLVTEECEATTNPLLIHSCSRASLKMRTISHEFARRSTGKNATPKSRPSRARRRRTDGTRTGRSGGARKVR